MLTPQSIDPAHPFPFLSNLSLNLLVTLNSAAGLDMQLARIKVPVGLSTYRFIRVPGKKDRFVRLEDLLMSNLGMLFPGMRSPADLDAPSGSHSQLIEYSEKRVELFRKRMKKKKIKHELDQQS